MENCNNSVKKPLVIGDNEIRYVKSCSRLAGLLTDSSARSINRMGQIIQHAESQKHGVYLHLLTKLSQLCRVVYHVQPIVIVYTHQNLWYTPCYWDSA